MDRQTALPTYEVEFIPLERRLREDRRKYSTCSYGGAERRRNWSRRNSEETSAKPRRPI